MIKEFERIVLTTDIPKAHLKKGDVGTVVMVYENGKGYEIEFFALDGSTVTIETVNSTDVRPVKKKEIIHVREIA